MNDNISGIDPRMEAGAVRVYENDMTDDFPVLKAFQQYIDAEQSKARKRLILLCMFFAGLMTILVAVFVLMIAQMNRDKQHANEQLIQFLMHDRDRQPTAVPQQDNAAFRMLADKLNDIQKKFDTERKNVDSLVVVKKDTPTAETVEIERLKALLSAEKEKAAIEREKKRQEELEEYRRKHYPELYEKPAVSNRKSRDRRREEEEADQEIEDILNEINAIDYYEDEDEDDNDRLPKKSKHKKSESTSKSTKADSYTIPVDVKDAAGNGWKIPLE